MKVLLHTCCAPCLIYPYEKLTKGNKNNFIMSFFYNPNIHPHSEYLARLNVVEEYCRKNNIPLARGKYNFEEYFRAVVFREKDRCLSCYYLRLGAVAKFARSGKFEAFTTTLLVSPHQDHDLIKQVGKSLAEEYKVKFLDEDFREGYKYSREKSKELGMYRQNYCGCLYSEEEKFKGKSEEEKFKEGKIMAQGSRLKAQGGGIR